MKKRLDRLKQAALERIGVADTTEVPQIKEDYKKVKGDELLFKELLKHLEKQLTYLQGYAESGEGIKANIVAWEKIAMERGENYKLVEGLKRFGEWQSSLNQQYIKLHQSMSERVVEVTKSFVKIDIAETKAQKQKWVKLRQTYDASEAKLVAAEKANKTKIDEIKEEHNEVMRSYLKAEVDTSAILAKTLKACEKLLVDLVGQYWGVYSSAFLQAYQLSERVKTSLDSLQLYPSGTIKARSSSIVSPHLAEGNKSPTTNKPPRLARVPSTKIFGIYLQDLWDNETRSFPTNLIQVVEHLEEHGPNEEEIFKSPGTPKHTAAIKKGLDEGTALNSCGVLGDSLSVAIVLRDFLLQLPDPVIPVDSLSQYMAISDVPDPQEKIAQVLKINQTLPEPHRVFLDMIVHMGGVICRNPFTELETFKATRFTNDMAIDLAVVLGPACMRSNGLSPDPNVESTAINLFKFLILNADSLCTEKQKPEEPRKSQLCTNGNSTRNTDTLKFETTQLITDIIAQLDMVKMRAGATVSFEECTPYVLRIKNVLQNTQKLKGKVKSEVAKVDKSALLASGDDKLLKAQNAVKVFSDEIQAILMALKLDVALTHETADTTDTWKELVDNLEQTQSMLLL